MKKYLIVILILISLTACNKSNSNEEKVEKEKVSSDVNIVTSLEDKIENNTIWCGTFNLVWNELKERILGGDAIVNPEIEMITNLNKSTFNKDSLEDSSYYTKIAKQT